jgi:diaminopimelate decarboxylase
MTSISVRDPLWPATATWPDGELHIGGLSVRDLAAEFGTALYVLDEADFRERCSTWLAAFPDGDVHYGGKAFLAPAVVRWLRELGLCLDVCSGGELAVARVGGMPPDRVVFHGNNKSVAEIRQAVEWGVGCIVLDSLQELERVARIASGLGIRQKVMVRLKPGVDAATHAALATGGERTKFGLSIASGAADEAVRRVLADPALELIGLHSHIGSQIFDLDSFAEAAHRMVAFLRTVEHTHRTTVGRLDLGGGLGVSYVAGEKPAPTPAALADALRAVVPNDIHVSVEPGRAIAAPTTVAVYEVGTVKDRFVAIDGGMSDNPRPATYGAAYTAVVASRTGSADGRSADDRSAASRSMTVVGKHCESGDILIEDIGLPADIAPGDLLAVPCSGAYQRSAASNYNLVPRPPVVAVWDGAAQVIMRRETEEDLLRLYP